MPASRCSPLLPPAGSRRGRDEAGQGSVEYTAVLAVVAVVLALAATLAGAAGAGGIANAVGRGLERALCVAGGGDCYATEARACTLRSSETSGRLGVALTFVELGGRVSLLRQQLSDGTVDVTLVEGADGAPTAAVGARGGIRTGAGGVGAGAISSAELLVRLGRRRVWHVAGAAAADRLVRAIGRDVAFRLAVHAAGGLGAPVRALARLAGVDLPRLPAADEAGFSGGVRGAAAAEVAGASVTAAAEVSLGGSRERATGRTSVVLALDGQASGALGRAAGGATLSGSAGASATVTFDRSGTPLDLAVSVAGSPRPGLGGGLGGPAGHKAGGGADDRVERTTHLDLTRSDNRVVYDGVMRSLSDPRRLPGALAALAGRLGVAGRQDLVRYRTSAATYGAAAEGALGARAGGQVELSRTAMTLQDAWTRPAGGVWEPRTDCLGARGA